jgi:uncharacterized damage-inducible protein DinB
MHPLEGYAILGEWAARNTVHNLRFLPAERLAWKPAPTAASALEIIQHVCAALRSMQPVLADGEYSWNPPPLPSTLEEAEELLLTTAREYAAALRAVDPATLSRQVRVTRWAFETPLRRAATMPVVDLVHHHGQICYLQTLLGDTEYHFFDRP